MDRVRHSFNPWLRLSMSLGLIVVGGWLLATQSSPSITGPRPPRPTFVWGASVIPYPTGPANAETLTRVVTLSRELGLRVVRTEIPPGLKTTEAKFAYLDPLVDAAHDAGLQVMLIIHWKWEGEDEDVFGKPNLEALARDRAQAVASHYRGKVQYYQLGNEIPTTALKGSWSGSTPDAYDADRYAATLAWLRASIDGVHAGDRRAKTLTTANWLQYGFFERAFADGLATDILGWDWFDEDQDIHAIQEGDQRIDLPERLAQFGKPVWFVEAGYSASTHTEAEQADLNDAFFKDLANTPAVTGALVQILADQVNNIGTAGEHDGIVPLDYTNPAVPVIGEPRPAYHRLQQLIDQISGRPKR